MPQLGPIQPRWRCPIRAVIFDFDGTLAETNIDFARMRSEVLDLAEQWGLRDGLDEKRYILEIVEEAAARLSTAEDRRRFYHQAEVAMQAVELEATSIALPFPGVPQALQLLLDHGIHVGIITRNCQAGVRALLQRHPIPHEVLLTRDDVELVKPHPSHLQRALQLLGVAPAEAIMVGDHPTDIQTGQAAGTFTAGVLTAKTTREQFQQTSADYVAEDVPELVQVILAGCAGA